ncbi:FAD-binding oxidoreductase [Leucobacter allii]|uniref:FAD-binding oxidoreductase n=1 Tax=Leucobacter allii TaxID=2932247 RepID=A0ABY4FLN6_9MICO|nr:FAD-dependent oxidoreductase [Leucobacter allii]UOQ57175.1 FAD-binding oxidoreductase [Leucobacter allii]
MDGPLAADYAVVGGGLSGLWTAYFLKTMHPDADVVVLEAERVSAGASGRACGWLSGKPIGVRDQLAKTHGRAAVIRTEEIVRDSLDTITGIFAAAGKDIGAHKGGTLLVARSASETARVRDAVAAAHRWGVPEDRMRMLGAAETRARVAVSRAESGAFSPDMVRVDPARMTVALAEIVRDLGVPIYERSRVAFPRGSAPTANGHPVVAERFAIATEGYTSTLPGRGRLMLPMNSSLIATRPLTDAEWDAVGWSEAEGVSGAAHTYFYSARTPDGRIALGGRGKPYRYGSGFDRDGVVDRATVSSLTRMLRDLFPQIAAEVDYAWCGVIGVSRDWSPFVHRFGPSGSVIMGGYAGQGLTAAHLAGRIAASLLTETDDEYVQLPWVRALPRNWEPEPLRWIGANGLYRVYSVADVLEHRGTSGRTALIAKAADRIAGRSTRPARS